MLGKLCKHELKATARYFLPLFLIALVLTPITRFTVLSSEFPGLLKFIPIVIAFAYIASLLVIAAASVLLIIHRFYKSMVTEEGYLMHTLPVSIETHIFAKLIIAALWSIASLFVIFISLFMMFYTPERFSDLMDILNEFWNSIAIYKIGGQLTIVIIESVVMILFGIFTAPLIFYASIAIGQIILKNKILGSVLGFFIIQVVSQVLGLISLIPFGGNLNFVNDTLSVTSQIQLMTNLFFPIILIRGLISSIILFLITDFIFKKKLNLE